MILFSSVNFFAFSASIPLSIIAYKLLRPRYSGYFIFISCITAIFLFLIYGASAKIPLLLFFWFFCILCATNKRWITKTSGAALSLLPLLLLKFHLLSFFAMLGISFATFRTIDAILTAEETQEIDILEYFVYLFFPLTILAGPLYRWRKYKHDIAEAFQRISLIQFLTGWEILLLGIIQKFAFAHVISIAILQRVAPHDYSIHGILSNAIGYSAYLYFDFAGYSNMAIGIAAMFGFVLPINFRNPIAAQNPQDFWRRWHISLSEWLRDVVFIPIYKNLLKFDFFSIHKITAQNIGIMVTLLIMGTWNGIKKEYVISGLLFGLYSVSHNTVVHIAKSNQTIQAILELGVSKFAGRLITIASAILSLYVFSGRSPI